MKPIKIILCIFVFILALEFTNVEAFAKTTQDKTTKVAVVVKKSAKAKYTQEELRLLSSIIYCEAGSESYNGKLAVGIVVMNRVKSRRYPNTVKSVIYQKSQFSPVRSGSLKKVLKDYDKGGFKSTREKDAIKAAKAALNGQKTITVKGKQKNFSGFLSFSGKIKGYTYQLGNHQFK